MRLIRKIDRGALTFDCRKSAGTLGVLVCGVLAAAAVALPAGAAAQTPAPATGTLYFSKATAKLVGGTVLVPVQCAGAKGSVCNGELSLQAGEATSETPFSVSSGGNRTISVPAPVATPGTAVVATATTAQSAGSYATATEVLHLR